MRERIIVSRQKSIMPNTKSMSTKNNGGETTHPGVGTSTPPSVGAPNAPNPHDQCPVALEDLLLQMSQHETLRLGKQAVSEYLDFSCDATTSYTIRNLVAEKNTNKFFFFF